MGIFDQLVKRYNAGDRSAIEQLSIIFSCLHEKEAYILRELYGISTYVRSKEDLAGELGMSVENVERAHNKALTVIDTIAKEYPERIIAPDNLQTLLSHFPAFLQMRKEKKYKAPLSRYKNYTLKDFIRAYRHEHLQGKEVYDFLMQKLIAATIGTIPDKPETESVVTVFPSSYDDKQPIGMTFRQMISEMTAYYQGTSAIEKNRKRAGILNKIYFEGKDNRQIATELNITVPTIDQNFLSPLFGNGYVDEVSIQPAFFAALKDYRTVALYAPPRLVEDKVQLHGKEFSGFLSILSLGILEEKPEYRQDEIIIGSRDQMKVNKCLFCLFDTLSRLVIPVTTSELLDEVKKAVPEGMWLEEFVLSAIKNNPSVIKDNDKVYLEDQKLKSKASRISRIVYNSAYKMLKAADIQDKYCSIYKEDLKYIPTQKDLKPVHIIVESKGGYYRYVANGQSVQTVNLFMDEYFSRHILFRWRDLLSELQKKWSDIKVKSKRDYAVKHCTPCAQDSDILVLKGHEQDYPQYEWSTPRKTDKTNFFVNQAVMILEAKPGKEMPYRSLLRELNAVVTGNGYSDHTTGTVIKKYTNEDPKLFIQEKGNIRFDDVVLQDVNLDTIGKGFKYDGFYASIYALAVTELKKRDGKKMLRRDLADMATKIIDGKISSKIVSKAFEVSSKPDFLTLESSGKSVYVCLDASSFNQEHASEFQYKVDATEAEDNVETVPDLVVDTQQRPDVTYRTIFNWNDILTALKKDLKHYDKAFFYPGITADGVLLKFKQFMEKSCNLYLRQIIPQAYYELSYASIDRWSAFDYRSKFARAFETLLTDIYYQNYGVELHASGLAEILQEKEFLDFAVARHNHDRKGFAGIFNYIYSDRNLFAHTNVSDLPSLLNCVQSCISYMALYVYTVAKYYHPETK